VIVEIYFWSGAGLLVAALVALFRMHVEQHRRIARFGDRLAHLTSAVSLLTDTVEGGLRDMAQEIERLGAPARPAAKTKTKARASTQRRVSTAARRGRSVQDIAAKEKMSESEVRLRLQMAGANREKVHAAMR
jgi:hypothetical protein